MTEKFVKPILSIETSGEICGASVFFDEKKSFELNIHEKNIHSEKLLEVVDNVLTISQTKLNEVAAIAVSAGPGSFTGLRIGFSAAKGLAFGANLPIIPVPTFEALALQISSSIPDKTKFIICNKVNNEEVYFGKFVINENKYSLLEKIKVIGLTELSINQDSINLIYGNCKMEESLGVISKPISAPDAAFVAKWAYIYGKDLLTFNYDFLEPNYLKNFIIR
ncbi:MAG: tRNA (adenosine(37)-N6)-threonylcarbamoyltransferase complex dimerization subunit type 1 TsaB [Ignavibacteriales bacterium]|nr:tRNA (adenosine(37)-N6)-threonylcarbamoyltransferase complex dimerization subunit type 1 TsaB [Ignavibacteriales bacterium]